MSTLTGAWLLLAERNTTMFRNMGSGFRHKQENFNPAELLLWAAVLVAVFWGLNLVSKLVSRPDKRRVYHSPRALFRSLCKAHELDAASRRRLKQLAASQRVSPAARIFLLPEAFEPQSLGASFAAQQEQIAALRDRLFGDELAAAGTEEVSG